MTQTGSSSGVPLFRPAMRKIDVLTAPRFQEDLASAMEGVDRLILDLSEVQFIDSSGLGKIIANLRGFRERGGELRICGVQAPVQVLFSMVRLGDIVGIFAGREEAEASFAPKKAPGGAER